MTHYLVWWQPLAAKLSRHRHASCSPAAQKSTVYYLLLILMQTATNLNSPIVRQALAGTVANFGGLYHEAVTNLAANLFTI
jgi:hypothetical protein